MPSDEHVIPGWTGFNAIMCEDVIPWVLGIFQ